MPTTGRQRAAHPRTAAVAAACVALLVSCSGGADRAEAPAANRVNPRDYAVNVCGRLQSWIDHLEDDVKALSDATAKIPDDPAGRRKILIATTASIRRQTA